MNVCCFLEVDTQRFKMGFSAINLFVYGISPFAAQVIRLRAHDEVTCDRFWVGDKLSGLHVPTRSGQVLKI